MNVYRYKPKITTFFLIVLFFGYAIRMFGFLASTNDRGLVINGLIVLQPNVATLFYWFLLLILIFFFLVCFILIVRLSIFPQWVRLTEISIVIPKSRWSSAELTIDIAAITGLSVLRISGQKYLYIDHANGISTLVASLLPNKQVFIDICQYLQQEIESVKNSKEKK